MSDEDGGEQDAEDKATTEQYPVQNTNQGGTKKKKKKKKKRAKNTVENGGEVDNKQSVR